MNYFSLVKRNKEEIMKTVEELAKSYVPLWRFEPGDRNDPGAALVEIFAEMFEGTIDRLNEAPERFYCEYLNILGVEDARPVAAEGLVQFNVAGAVTDTVRVPERSLVYIPDEDENIVYETCQPIDAYYNEIKAAYYLNSIENRIEKLDFNESENFFTKGDHENLQKHCFSITQNEIFALKGKAEFRLTLKAETDHIRNEVLSCLSDREHARWFYRTEDGEKLIDEISIGLGTLQMTKNAEDEIIADENGNYSLHCDLTGNWEDFHLEGLTVGGKSLKGLHADELYNGEFPIIMGKGGYCFGRIPAPLEEFYIKSDAAFNKKGAEVNLLFDLDIVTYTTFDDTTPQYTYGENIIDKNAAVAVRAEDVYINEIVWEYYNGIGWNYIEAKGTVNPFSGQNDGALAVRFTIPEDIEPTEVNAEEGFYIRARVVSLENGFSSRPRWLLPFVRNVTIDWNYSEDRIPQRFEMSNNAKTDIVEGWDGRSSVRLDVFSSLESVCPSVYLCFERPLKGLPFSMMFVLENNSVLLEQVRYEIWTGKRFETVHVIDDTNNLSHSGPVYCYFNIPSEEGEFFGQSGYWMKISAGRKPVKNERLCPKVEKILFNVSKIEQCRHAEEEIFSNDDYEKNKKITLLNKPILQIDVWVNETDRIKTEDVARIKREYPHRIREIEREDGGIDYWLRWHQVRKNDIIDSNNRVYWLDPYNGEITFGDGIYGMILPEGFENVRVEYVYGGGTSGNAERGVLKEFLIPVPRIESLTNITALTGGMGKGNRNRLLRYGKYRVRHHNRAVSIDDFDNLVYENFGNIAHVKSFDGLDAEGKKAAGHVTVVINGMLEGNERTEKELCSKVKHFLEKNCDCTLAGSGLLEVRTAIKIEIVADVSVAIINPDKAAETQEKVKETIRKLIDEKWRAREIGDQIRINEVYKALKAVRNIRSIRKIIFEGRWYENGKRMLAPVETNSQFPYATVKSGEHKVNIEL